MGVVHDAVQDGVGQGWVADDVVPAVDRRLAGDDQRPGVVAILDDLQQIALLFGGQRLRPPIVQDQQVDPGELLEQPGIPPVAASQAKAANSRGTLW